MSVPAHPHFLFFHYRWPRGSHHRDRKYGYYYFYVCIVNGKLNQNTDLTLVNCVSWESDNTISKIGNRVFVTLGVQITSEQSSGSLIIASIARTYYPKTTYVRANAAGGTNGDNHMLYINKSNGVVILNLSTERYYSASFSYLAN